MPFSEKNFKRQKVGFSRFWVFGVSATNSKTNSNPIFTDPILCQKVRKTPDFVVKSGVFMAYTTLMDTRSGKCNAIWLGVAFFMLHYSANLVCIIPITVLSFRKIQLDNFPFLRQYIQQPNIRRYCMTKQQASAEMKYRLSIYILQVLLDRGDITTEEAICAKNILLDRYDPFTRCLEEVDVWQTEL